jgi:tRNA (cmo5U34)-methyltransferase
MTWQFDEKIADIFEQHAEEHIPNYLGVIEKSVDLCDLLLKKNSSIIDIGCATGKTLKELNRRGFKNLHGVDSSQAMLDKIDPALAKLYLSSRLPLSSYNAALMNWTLHFIENKRVYLDDIYDGLQPDGFLILSEKTANESPHLDLYHLFKKRKGVSDIDIQAKADSLKGRMFIHDQQWYKSALMAAGFRDISIISADWCFTTFLAFK